MAAFKMALLESLRKYRGTREADMLREGIQVLTHALTELEVSQQIGVERYERSPERRSYRNGYRMCGWAKRVGTIPLRIPGLRERRYFPSLLQPRRRAEHALLAVIQEAYMHEVSTRKVDELVRALGLEGLARASGLNPRSKPRSSTYMCRQKQDQLGHQRDEEEAADKDHDVGDEFPQNRHHRQFGEAAHQKQQHAEWRREQPDH